KNAPQKPSSVVLQALETEILRKLQNQYPDMVTRVGFSSQQRVNISGTKIAEDKTRIEEILEEIWMDDGWVPEEEQVE
ncbi:DinI-like family protein, partial [Providencia hangzhouensis]